MTHTQNNPFDNAGPPIPGATVNKVFEPTESTFVDCAREDMAAFDILGPLTRAVMRDMAVRFSAAQAVQMIRQMWRADPTAAAIDAKMAAMIRQHEPAILELIRVSDQNDLAQLDRTVAGATNRAPPTNTHPRPPQPSSRRF